MRQSDIDRILLEMTNIYTMFCLPVIIKDNKTNKIIISYKWQSKQAKEAFEKLGELLVYERNQE